MRVYCAMIPQGFKEISNTAQLHLGLHCGTDQDQGEILAQVMSDRGSVDSVVAGALGPFLATIAPCQGVQTSDSCLNPPEKGCYRTKMVPLVQSTKVASP